MPAGRGSPDKRAEMPAGSASDDTLHELNNMLASIRIALQVLRRRAGADREDLSRPLDNGMAAVDRAAELARQLAGQRSAARRRREPVDLASHLPAALKIPVEREPGLDATIVRCDGTALAQALGALAAALGGNTCRLRLGPDGSGERITLLLSGDNAAVATSAAPPLGLALAQLYGCIAEAGGSLQADLRPAHACAIRIDLPPDRPEDRMEHREKQEAAAAATSAGGTVLVVEDEALIRMAIVETLEEQGYRVLTAADGQEALGLIQSDVALDLLATDVGLPGLNGQELASIARAQRPALKILLMTGHADPSAVGQPAPSDIAVLAKPFDIDVLSAKIRTLLDQRVP